MTDSKEHKPSCQICGAEISKEHIVYCTRCTTPHHKECWEFNGKCSTFACGETKFRDELVSADDLVSPEPLLSSDQRQGLILIMVSFLMVAFFLVLLRARGRKRNVRYKQLLVNQHKVRKTKQFPVIRPLLDEAARKIAQCPDSSNEKPRAMVRLAALFARIGERRVAEEMASKAVCILLDRAKRNPQVYSDLQLLARDLDESNVRLARNKMSALIADSILMWHKDEWQKCIAAVDLHILDESRFHALLRQIRKSSNEHRRAFLAHAVPRLIFNGKIDKASLVTFTLSNVSKEALGDMVTYLVRSGNVRRAWELLNGYGQYRYKGLELGEVRQRFYAALAAVRYNKFDGKKMELVVEPTAKQRELEWLAALYRSKWSANSYSDNDLNEMWNIVRTYDYWSLPLLAAHVAHRMKKPMESYEFLAAAGRNFARAPASKFALSSYSAMERERAFVDCSLSIGSWHWIKTALIERGYYNFVDSVEKVTRQCVKHEKIELAEELLKNLQRRCRPEIANACCQVLVEARGVKAGRTFARVNGVENNVMTLVSLARSAVLKRLGPSSSFNLLYDVFYKVRKKKHLVWFSKEKPFSDYVRTKLDSLKPSAEDIWVKLEEAKASVQAGKRTDLSFLNKANSLTSKDRLLFVIEGTRLLGLSRKNKKAKEYFSKGFSSINPTEFPLGPYDWAGIEFNHLPIEAYDWFIKTGRQKLLRRIVKDVSAMGDTPLVKQIIKKTEQVNASAFFIEEPFIERAANVGDIHSVREIISSVLKRRGNYSAYSPSFFRAIANGARAYGMSLVKLEKHLLLNPEAKASFLVAAAAGLAERDENDALSCIDRAIIITHDEGEYVKYRIHLRAALVLAKMNRMTKAREITRAIGFDDYTAAKKFVALEKRALSNQPGTALAVPLFITLGNYMKARQIAAAFDERIAANMLPLAKQELIKYSLSRAVEIGMLLPLNELVEFIESSLSSKNLRPVTLLIGRLRLKDTKTGDALAAKVCEISLQRKKKLRAFEAMELISSKRFLKRVSLINSY